MTRRIAVSVLSVAVALCATGRAFAGGAGQNMLLVVNPNDENALRVANAYAEMRHIPDRNIVHIVPPSDAGWTDLRMNWSEFESTYLNAIPAAITSRGLDGQIDYIATVGQSHSMKEDSTTLSLNYCLSLLTPFQNGQAFSTAYARWSLTEETPSPVTGEFPYVQNTNQAIHHSDGYGHFSDHFYLSGNVGHTGRNSSISAAQLIDRLQRTTAADGTKPEGTVYFEDGSDVRVTTRKPYWPTVQDHLTATGQAWIQEGPVTGKTPRNRDDVRGAVTGSAWASFPNGSTYLPGSWADNMTSSGGAYTTSDQTKSSQILLSGAGATCGTVTEPYAIQSRFTYASIYAFSNDGSTLAESFAKAIAQPDLQMFEGDMLSQAYADVPDVQLTAAPPQDQAVSGSVSLSASASLTDPDLATGIAQLELYVDGLLHQTIPAASGSFNVDTTALSDGRHELRVVAVNNAAAESENCVISDFVVNNHGRSVAAGSDACTTGWDETVQVPVSSTAGDGSVDRIEMRCLGRTVGQVSGEGGSVGVDATTLAYGTNRLVPVAVYADGSEVAGAAVTVEREFNKLSSLDVTPSEDRLPGVKIEYWTGKAGETIAATDFSGEPDHTLIVDNSSISPNNGDPDKRHIPDEYRVNAGGTNEDLAARVSGRFEVTEEGEYAFCVNPYSFRWSGMAMYVDGQPLGGFDSWDGSSFVGQGLAGTSVDTTGSVYLLPGEHEFTMLMANAKQQYDDWAFATRVVSWRDLEGEWHDVDENAFYVPEPASVVLLGVGAVTLLRRRRTAK